jgi:hypothetical protein
MTVFKAILWPNAILCGTCHSFMDRVELNIFDYLAAGKTFTQLDLDKRKELEDAAIKVTCKHLDCKDKDKIFKFPLTVMELEEVEVQK